MALAVWWGSGQRKSAHGSVLKSPDFRWEPLSGVEKNRTWRVAIMASEPEGDRVGDGKNCSSLSSSDEREGLDGPEVSGYPR